MHTVEPVDSNHQIDLAVLGDVWDKDWWHVCHKVQPLALSRCFQELFHLNSCSIAIVADTRSVAFTRSQYWLCKRSNSLLVH